MDLLFLPLIFFLFPGFLSFSFHRLPSESKTDGTWASLIISPLTEGRRDERERKVRQDEATVDLGRGKEGVERL